MMHTIYGQPVTREVRDQVTIAVNMAGKTHMLFKILFVNARPDFYIALPYLNVNYFKCGLVATEFDIPHTIEGGLSLPDAKVPVKLSYHESGQVHLKATSTDIELKLPLTSVQSLPIAYFDGSHLFTIELEGVHLFREASEKHKKREGFFAYDVPSDVKRIKVFAFGAFAEELVSRYRAPNGVTLKPTAVMAFRRAQYRVPLYIGIYMQYGPSIQTDLRGAAYELLLGGFTSRSESGEYIYMHASV